MDLWGGFLSTIDSENLCQKLPELATCPCDCCQGRSTDFTDELGGSCLGIWLLAQEPSSFGIHMQEQAADCSPDCSQGAGLGGHLQGLPLHHPAILCSMGSSCLAPVAAKSHERWSYACNACCMMEMLFCCKPISCPLARMVK